MLVSASDVQKAKAVAKTVLKNQCIPTFEAQGVEVTRNNESEMIIYCESLVEVKEDHKFSVKASCDSEDIQGLYIQKNYASVVKLQNFTEEFAIYDLQNDADEE